jgi:hypothetical protein
MMVVRYRIHYRWLGVLCVLSVLEGCLLAALGADIPTAVFGIGLLVVASLAGARIARPHSVTVQRTTEPS